MNWLRMIAMILVVTFAVPAEAQSETQTEAQTDVEARQLIASALTDIEIILGNAELARLQRDSPSIDVTAGIFGSLGVYDGAMQRAQTLKSELDGRGIRLTGFSVTLTIPPSVTLSFEFPESE